MTNRIHACVFGSGHTVTKPEQLTATGGAPSGCVIHQPAWDVFPIRSTASSKPSTHDRFRPDSSIVTGMEMLPGPA